MVLKPALLCIRNRRFIKNKESLLKLIPSSTVSIALSSDSTNWALAISVEKTIDNTSTIAVLTDLGEVAIIEIKGNFLKGLRNNCAINKAGMAEHPSLYSECHKKLSCSLLFNYVQSRAGFKPSDLAFVVSMVCLNLMTGTIGMV